MNIILSLSKWLNITLFYERYLWLLFKIIINCVVCKFFTCTALVVFATFIFHTPPLKDIFHHRRAWRFTIFSISKSAKHFNVLIPKENLSMMLKTTLISSLLVRDDFQQLPKIDVILFVRKIWLEWIFLSIHLGATMDIFGILF